jgi:hypothetical protein
MGRKTFLTKDKPRASRGCANRFTPRVGGTSRGMNANEMQVCIHPAHGASCKSLFRSTHMTSLWDVTFWREQKVGEYIYGKLVL